MTTTAQQTKTYRASRAPLHWACPGSAYGDDDAVAINRIDEAGTIGAAVHEAAAAIAQGEGADTGAIALKYGLDEKTKRDFVIMTAIATRFWAEYRHYFQKPRSVEVEWEATDAIPMSGHVDVSGLDNENWVNILDWKTTRLEAVNYRAQMMQYLWLAHNARGSAYAVLEGAPGYRYVICFLRDKTVEVSEVFTPEQLQEWHDAYVEKILTWDNRTYSPGGHCHYCPRYACCPGRREMVRAEITALVSGDGAYRTIHELSEPQCVDAYERLRAIEKFLGETVSAIKTRCEDAGGTLQGDGKALVMKERRVKKILGQPAWPVLTKHLTYDELAPCVTVGKGAVEHAVAAKVDKGKGKVKKALIAELEAAGAIEERLDRYPAIVAALPITETEIPDNEENQNDQENKQTS